MTQQEIEHLKSTVTKSIFNKNDPLWRKAFIEYHQQTGIKLGLGCTSCYFKVAKYHIDKK